MLGVAWPEMRISFQQPISVAGSVPPLGVAATLICSTSTSHRLHRIGLGAAACRQFTPFRRRTGRLRSQPVDGIVPCQRGAPGSVERRIDATLNTYAARAFGPRRINLLHPLLVLTTAERTSAAVADRMIGFQAAASALGAAVIPALIGLAMGVSVGAFAPAIAPLCLTAAFLHVAMQMRRRS